MVVGCLQPFRHNTKRETTDSGCRLIRFAFTSKHGNSKHQAQHRNRLGDGSTGNLTKRGQTCDQQRLANSHSTSTNPATSTATKPAYDSHRHRALIASAALAIIDPLIWLKMKGTRWKLLCSIRARPFRRLRPFLAVHRTCGLSHPHSLHPTFLYVFGPLSLLLGTNFETDSFQTYTRAIYGAIDG